MPVFRDYNQSQGVFRSIRPNELLEPDHPARVIDKVVEMLDLSEVYADYAEEGNPPYHAQMMLKVLFYAYYCGSMSCRKIWEDLKERADFIFLSGDQVPDFRTVNSFRTRHMKVLPKLFAQIVMICVRLDMLDFQHLAIDGQRIKANANYRRSKNRQRTRAIVQAGEGGNRTGDIQTRERRFHRAEEGPAAGEACGAERRPSGAEEAPGVPGGRGGHGEHERS